MNARLDLTNELLNLTERMRELEIRYEQYFAGVEKREPLRAREDLTLRLRRLYLRNVTQTDVRFRINSLNRRFQSYSQYWDRILRLIEEGRFHRGRSRTVPPPAAQPATETAATPMETELDRLYREMQQAHLSSGTTEPLPSRQQLGTFLDRQQETIRQKFGDKAVDYAVEIAGGKPKIVVRTRKG